MVPVLVGDDVVVVPVLVGDDVVVVPVSVGDDVVVVPVSVGDDVGDDVVVVPVPVGDDVVVVPVPVSITCSEGTGIGGTGISSLVADLAITSTNFSEFEFIFLNLDVPKVVEG